jgi:hypothetical protein
MKSAFYQRKRRLQSDRESMSIVDAMAGHGDDAVRGWHVQANSSWRTKYFFGSAQKNLEAIPFFVQFTQRYIGYKL